MKGTFAIFLVFLTTYVCGNTTPDDDWKHTVLSRLADLEQYKRDSTAKIEALTEIVQNHEATINTHETITKNHESKIKSLEQELLVQKSTIYQQGKLLRRTRKTMKSLVLSANRSMPSVDAAADGHPDLQEPGVNTEFNNGTGRPHSRAVRSTDQHTASKRQGIAGGIAFTAFLDHDVDLGAHQTIKFNQVITNEGNGYNVHTGVFTCVEGGVYLLYASVGERGAGAGAHIEIIVNSRNLVDGVVDTKHTTQDLQGSNMVVVRLKQGDSVWVDSNGFRDHVITNDGNGYNLHTGVFTCVESGVYLLFASIGERGQIRGTAIHIIVNNQNLVDGIVDTWHSGQDLQGSNMVVVRLTQGDAVWVDVNDAGSHVEGDSGLRLTTFTGIFLYA